MPDFGPVRLLDVELSHAPLLDIQRAALEGGYERFRVLARLHGRPLAYVDLDVDRLGVTEWAAQLWQAVGGAAASHLRDDDYLASPGTLEDLEVPFGQIPPCQRERALLAQTAPFVTVVVATRDRADSVYECVLSLLALDYPHFEVVIVDNAPSSDATARRVRELAATRSELRYVFEPTAGVSSARNRGLGVATGQLIAYVDDDVLVDPNWLLEIVAAFRCGANVGCVTGAILPHALDTPAQLLLEQYGGYSRGFTPRLFDDAQHRPRDPLFPYTAGRFGSGANITFRVDVLTKLGGYDLDLGPATPVHGGEDLDIMFRVINAGYQLAYWPAAMVRHRHPPNYEQLQHAMFVYGLAVAAFLTKWMLRHPRHAWGIGARLPRGIAYAVAASSSKNRAKTAAFPISLTLRELLGMLCGPFAYLRSRARRRIASSAFRVEPFAPRPGLQ